MAQTRSKSARNVHNNKLSRRRVYRYRVKTSRCRGNPVTQCKGTCKPTKTGKRRAYCRKRANSRV